MNIKILHTADIQVQSRDKNLRVSYEKALKNIEQVIREQEIDVYLIAGDLFEYAESNEIEKKVMYQHLSRALSIDTLKELVIMAGNHDLVKLKHVKENEEDENSINTFVETIMSLDDEYRSKLNYLKRSRPTPSLATPSLVWYPYSLEDDLSLKDIPDTVIANVESLKAEGKHVVTIFHDMIREYVEESKLPVPKARFDSMHGMKDFHTPYILAGDIHVNWQCVDEEGKTFIYPGSPIQRNFGEGSYFKVGKDVIEIDADHKYVKLYDFDTDTLKLSFVQDVQLPDMVAYNTVETMQDTTLETFFSSLEKIISRFRFGEEQTFIKLKLSNVFVSRELEIHKIITMKTMEHKRVNIEIKYVKFVSTTASSMIEKILSDGEEQPSGDSQDETTTETTIPEEASFDNLVLTDNQLRKLFMHVLDTRFEKVAKEYASDKEFLTRVYNRVMEIFDTEIVECLSGVRKIDVELLSVECNTFMSLGSNKIVLNAPGITRVSGTNGIGKTTLYNMLRWVIRNTVYEGMPKSQVKKNTLLVFNNKLPDIDNVTVILNQKVNGVPVTITRSATRSWKRNVTREQKMSLEWKEYIQGVTSELEVRVHKNDGDKVYIGDQAQMYVDAWFGNAPETIMFINYVKILQTLNTPPKELNDIILNFIGVDYLDKMEARIPDIKSELDITRPKRSKEDIRAAIIDKQNLKQSSEKDIEDREGAVKSMDESIVNTRESLREINERLQSFGNLENLISEKHVQKTNLEQRVNNFETWKKRDHLPLETVEPVAPDTGKLKGIIDELKEKESDVTGKLESLVEERNKRVRDLIQNYNDALNTVGAARDQMKELVMTKSREIQQIESSILAKTTELKSGVCPTCKRPYEDADLFEKTKKRLQEEIDECNEKLVLVKADKESRQEKYELIAVKYNDLKSSLDLAMQNNFDSIRETNDGRVVLIQTINNLDAEINDVNEQSRQVKRDIDAAHVREREIMDKYQKEMSSYNEAVRENQRLNKEIDEHNERMMEHNQEIETLKHSLQTVSIELETLQSKLPAYNEVRDRRDSINVEIRNMEMTLRKENEELTSAKVMKNQIDNDLQKLEDELSACVQYMINNQIFTLYNNLIKTDFKAIVFEYYRNFLNSSLNSLLEDVNFKLFFNNDSELYMIDMSKGSVSYTPCQQTSGMESVFLGLSLLYMMSVLNIKNSVNLVCIDELSGQLNKGKDLTYEAKDYCELFVSILSRFTKKNVIIVDHQVDNMFETLRYEVTGTPEGSKFISR